MNPQDRDRWDEQNRDEAAARALQQKSAGSTHAPVLPESYENATLQPRATDGDADAALLVREYELALRAESDAWLAYSEQAGGQAWNVWRDAAEQTQRAARALINFGRAR